MKGPLQAQWITVWRDAVQEMHIFFKYPHLIPKYSKFWKLCLVQTHHHCCPSPQFIDGKLSQKENAPGSQVTQCLITREESQAYIPSSVGHCSMKVEHGNKVWPRRGEAVTCRTVWEPPAPVLAWVVTAKQDLDAMGLCIDGFWGFLSTEGSQKFWTSFNLWGARWRKWGWHQAVVAAAGTTLILHLGFSGSLHMNP